MVALESLPVALILGTEGLLGALFGGAGAVAFRPELQPSFRGPSLTSSCRGFA